MTELHAPTTPMPSTKQRLLDAAEEVFAAKGYEAASVEEITKRAGANRAAISFHFGGKERLYIETVKYAHRICHDGVPFPEWPEGTPAAERLRGFIRTVVTRMVAEPKPSATQVMMREMAQPTAACAEVVREYIRPMADRLMGILNELLPPETPVAKRYLIGFSIVSQCLFFRQNRPVAALLMGEEAFRQLDVEQLTEHITGVALAAIEASREN
jgi:TetR/AcrR family transcriptional regulator, regulator of cefoperazone and chloramphenicol sensitivity